jgi:hypothetical protein
MIIYTHKTRQLKWLLMVLLLFVYIQQGHGQDEVPEFATDRPDEAEAASLVPRKTVQLETGLYFQKDTEGASEHKMRGYPSALIRLGVLDWLELRVQSARKDSVVERGRRFRTSGFAPLGVGAKIKLWEERGLLPQAAFMTMVALPIGSRDFRPENPEPTLRLLLKNSLTDKLDLSYNLVYAWIEGDPTKGYAISLGFDLSDKFTIYGEAFGSKQTGEKAEHMADGGLMFKLLPNLQLDIGAGTALNSAAPDYFLTTGISVRLPR